ncbi:hypothetical protein CIHG_10050 [Coccidioides immitis H538.4]|uniref:Uncharacterized protein n=1 Tax=Coccidioides immitis H538.4 TaxID=396776 RepID=A0A0J8S574_COCIT|nr:hypothetical protein CIHG_10050 [Coccidioides immitis H538.4]
MAMVHYKCVIVNINNIKLILSISAKIKSNYFSSINISDYPISAATTHHLYTAPIPPTTAAAAPSLPLPLTTASLPLSGAIRVSACQMLVLEKQKEKKKKKKKKK